VERRIHPRKGAQTEHASPDADEADADLTRLNEAAGGDLASRKPEGKCALANSQNYA
jgi:hypothetical protein